MIASPTLSALRALAAPGAALCIVLVTLGLQAKSAGAVSPPAVPSAARASVTENLAALPRRIEIVYTLDGLISGRQTHRWQRDGERYRLETRSEATGLAGVFLSSKMTQTSSGRIGAKGLVPERYEMLRLTGKREILAFDHEHGTIDVTRVHPKKGKRTGKLPLPDDTQDPLSAIYQLSMLARNGDEGMIAAAGTKRVKNYAYHVLGDEARHTPLGKLDTLHVTRAGDEGDSDVHLWLSPRHHYLPVEIRYTDEDGHDWVLKATSLKTQ